MKLTFDERMLMTIYNTGTRGGTIDNLKKCVYAYLRTKTFSEI